MFSPVLHLKALAALLAQAFFFPQHLAICGHQIIVVSCWNRLSHLAVQVWNKLSSTEQGQPPLHSCWTRISFQKRDTLFAYTVHQMRSALGFLRLPWNSCGLGRVGRGVGAKWITQNSMGLIFAIHLGTRNRICEARETFSEAGLLRNSVVPWRKRCPQHFFLAVWMFPNRWWCAGGGFCFVFVFTSWGCNPVSSWYTNRYLVVDYCYLAENVLIENPSRPMPDLACLKQNKCLEMSSSLKAEVRGRFFLLCCMPHPLYLFSIFFRCGGELLLSFTSLLSVYVGFSKGNLCFT